jgi:hypothetical protein
MGSYHWYTSKDRAALAVLPASKVAKAVGVSVPAAKQARRRMGVVTSVKSGRQPTLFAEDIAAFFMLRESGFTYADIGRLKSISEAGVRNAMKRAAGTGFEIYKLRRESYVDL